MTFVFPQSWLLTLATLLAVLPAGATTLNWIDPAGGNASTASNWSPAQVPTAADFLSFDLPAAYTVSFNSSLNACNGFRFRDGNVSLFFNGGMAIGPSGIRLGDQVGDSLTVLMVTGTVTCNSNASVAQELDSWARLQVRTDDAVLSVAGSANDLFVGNSGDGFLDVIQGGTVLLDDDLHIGVNAFAQGVVTVGTRDAFSLQPSSLITDGPLGDIEVGFTGHGTLNVNTYGSVTCGGNLVVAKLESLGPNDGIVNVGEASSEASAVLTVEHDLLIGSNLDDPPGDAAFNVFQNGFAQVSGTTYVGHNANSDAVLHIEAGGLPGGEFHTRNLVLDWRAHLDFDGGRLFIDGGTLDSDGVPITISSTVGTLATGPELTFVSGASTTLPDTGSVPYSLTIGSNGLGKVGVQTGSTVTLTGDLLMGDQTGSTGVLTLAGGTLTGDDLDAGRLGAASILLSNGGQLVLGSADLGYQAGGTAAMNISGIGSDAHVSSLRIGRSAIVPSPTTNVTASSGGDVIADDVTVKRTGGLNLAAGGAASVTGKVTDRGFITLTGGTLLADSLVVESTGRLQGVGLVTGDIMNQGDVSPGASAGTLAVTGTFAQVAGASLTIELGNHATSEWDKVAVNGAVTFGGTLNLVTLPTFSAFPGDAFTIMTYTSRSGSFARVALNGGPLAGFTLVQSATSLQLKATGATDVEPVTALDPPRILALAGRRVASGAVFELSLPEAADVHLALFDVAGREVAVLRDGALGAGRYVHPVDGRIGSGMYFAKAVVRSGSRTEVRTCRVPIIR